MSPRLLNSIFCYLYTVNLSPTLIKFVKFGIVGATGIVLDFGITYLLRDVAGTPELLANAVGFTLAATSNYFLNRLWTWRSTNKNVAGEYARFFAVALVGLGINTLIVWSLTALMADTVTWTGFPMHSFWIAKAVATLVVTLWNFTANHLYTFRPRTS